MQISALLLLPQNHHNEDCGVLIGWLTVCLASQAMHCLSATQVVRGVGTGQGAAAGARRLLYRVKGLFGAGFYFIAT